MPLEKEKQSLVYPDSLAPSEELIAQANKQEYTSYGYSGGNDLFFFNVHEGSKPMCQSGYRIFFAYKNQDNMCLADNSVDAVLLLHGANKEDCYVYDYESKHLIYSSNDYMELVKIANQDQFIEKIEKYCEESLRYDYKLFSFREIEELITHNGGHKPRQLTEPPSPNDSYKKRSELLGEIYLQQEDIFSDSVFNKF